MSKFNNIYEQIIHNIQTQKIHIKELYEIPDKFWFKYCDELIKHRNLARKVLKQLQLKQQKDKNISILDIKDSDKIIFNISYQDILNNLIQFNFQYKEDFKNNLLNLSAFNGKIYIIICNGNYQNLLNLLLQYPINENERLINFISQTLQLKYNEYNNSLNSVSLKAGNTFHKVKFLQELNNNLIDRNVYIYLNVNLYDIKGTFDHELTHVIEHIIGKQEEINPDNTNLNNFLIKLNLSNDLLNIVKNTVITNLQQSEYKSIQKTIINGFKKLYQNQYKIYKDNQYNNYLKNIKSRNNFSKINDTLENRENWLNKYLINSQIFFKNNKDILEKYKNYITLFQNYGFDNINNKFQLQLLYLRTLLYYHLFKIIYSNSNIDEKIKNEFQVFKFRES